MRNGVIHDTIVLAAYESIAERGVEQLRLQHVAEEAGIEESTLRESFATKTDLIAAVLEDITRQFWCSVLDEGTPAERLRRHLTLLAEMVLARPMLFVVLADLEFHARRNPLVRSVVEDDERGWRRALADIFRDGAEDAIWPPGLDEEAAVELVIATAKGVRIAPEKARAVFEQLERILLQSNRNHEEA